MRIHLKLFALVTLVALALPHVAESAKLKVKTEQVVELTRFLEARPLDERSPEIRALLIEWEDKSKDVIDYVCPGVIAPIPADDIPYAAELLVQYIFGSAAHQIENPSKMGDVVTSQLAGVRSMLKAYSALLAADSSARIARFDELLAMDEAGTLADYLAPISVKECGQE